jgi:hypothetical protein
MKKNMRLVGIMVVAFALLSVPLIGKLLGVVNWSTFDLIAAGVMLFGAGFAIEVALRLVTKFEYRVAACIAILIVLALVWAELAVGLIGTPLAGS